MESDAVLLVLYAQRRDAEAFAQLVKRHAGLVFGVALRVTGDRAEAEDVAQACFLELARNAAAIRTSVLGWLHQAARSHALSSLRARAARRKHEAQAAVGRQSAGDLEEWRAISARVDEAVAALPEELQAPLILHYLEGRDQTEVAEMLGVNQSTVSRRLERGIEELRQRLGGSGAALPALALGSLLTANAVQAAPAALTAALGKMAMAGLGASAATGTAGAGTAAAAAGTGGLAMKIGAVALVAAVVTTAAVVSTRTDSSETQPSKPAVSAPVKGPMGSPASGTAFFTGWRGDGTGRYPDALPPAEWSRVMKSIVFDLRGQARKPADAAKETGEPLSGGDGYMHGINEWLVAGPFDAADFDSGLDKEFLANEGAIEPGEGEKASGVDWKKTKGPGFVVPKIENQTPGDAKVAYGVTWIYAKDAGIVNYFVSPRDGLKLWLNGKKVYDHKGKGTDPWKLQVGMALSKGWNRLNAKLTRGYGGGFWSYFAAQPQSAFETKNIRWMTPMPTPTVSSPVVVKDRVFTLSEYGLLLCLDKNDGKLLWVRQTLWPRAKPYAELFKDPVIAPLAEKARQAEAAQLAALNSKRLSAESPTSPYESAWGALKQPWAEVHDALEKLSPASVNKPKDEYQQNFAKYTSTPCSDGERVYVWSASGLANAFSLDGELLWAARDEIGAYKHHGFHASPVIAEGKLIVLSESNLIAFDTKTGAEAWRSKTSVSNYYGSLVMATFGGEACVVFCGYAARVKDGKIVYHEPQYIWGDNRPTPLVVNGDSVLMTIKGGEAYDLVKMSGGGEQLQATRTSRIQLYKDQTAENYLTSSSLYHDGLVYLVTPNTRKLIVADAATGKVAYTKELYSEGSAPGASHGRPGFSACPFVAGKRIYLPDNEGIIWVIEPGPQFKLVAANRIGNMEFIGGTECQEQFLSTPAVDGNRLYLRGSAFMYCIGEK